VPATAVTCPHCNIALNLQQSAVSPTRDSSGVGILVVAVVGMLGLLFLVAGFAVFGFAVRSAGPAFAPAGSTVGYPTPTYSPVSPSVSPPPVVEESAPPTESAP
jgi:hypothetical protein